MPTSSQNAELATLEECVDQLNDCVATLERYPRTALVFALRTHLVCLLQELLEQGVHSSEQMGRFLSELRSDVLRPRSER